MARDLGGRVVLVTGAASGIGRAIVARVAADGGRAVAADRDAAGLASLAAQDVATVVGDVRAPEDAARFAGAAIERFGRLDGAVLAAGVTRGAPALELDAAAWSEIIDVNLTGAFLTAQAAARAMKPGGRIVFVASVTGLRGVSGRAAYAASKGGVLALTSALAVDLAPQGLAVNCLVPGAIETPLVAAQHIGAASPIRTQYTARTPAGRYGAPAEVAAAAAFLLSADAAYVNGAALAVDGGYLATGMMFP